jgi:hypothetical protein
VVVLQEADGLLAVFGRVHVVAVALELRAKHPAKVGLVVDDQDLLAFG